MRKLIFLIMLLFFPSLIFSQNNSKDKETYYLNANDYIISSDSIKNFILNQYKVKDFSICASNRIYDLQNPFFMDSVIWLEYGVKNSPDTRDSFNSIQKKIILDYNEHKMFEPYSVSYFNCDTSSSDFIISFSNLIDNKKLYARIARNQDYFAEYVNRLSIDQSIIILLYFEKNKVEKMFYALSVQ